MLALSDALLYRYGNNEGVGCLELVQTVSLAYSFAGGVVALLLDCLVLSSAPILSESRLRAADSVPSAAIRCNRSYTALRLGLSLLLLRCRSYRM